MAKEQLTIAEKWIQRIDENSPEKMIEEADSVVDDGGSVYIFEDGSSVYEKRRNDWYPAGTYIQCSECDEYFKQDNATSGDNLCDQCVENRADAVEEAEEVSD